MNTRSGSLEKERLELEHQYWRAMQNGDSRTAMRLSADPCIVKGAQGVGQVEELTLDGKAVELEAADSSTWVRLEGHWVCAVHTEAIAGDPFGRVRGA